MLIPSTSALRGNINASLSRRVNANSQLTVALLDGLCKLIKKGEC